MPTDPLPLHDPGGLGIFALMAKALTPPPFQPDFRARRDRHVPAARAKAPTPTADREPAPKRGLMERLEYWFWSQRQRDLEAYLAQSADVHDLEARIRDLERQTIHRYF